MRIIILALIVFGMTLPMFSQTDWAEIGRFEESNKAIERGEKAIPKVVFIGNSITEGWPEKHPEFFEINNFAGRGISGQTTYQLLVRFREDVINLHPEVVVINGATNDIAENNYAYDEDRTFGNLVSMAELADANGIKVIMSGVLPASSFYWHPHIGNIPEKQQSLNKRIKEYAESKGYGYVDYYTPLVGEGGALDPVYTSDGVHPNRRGYDIMEEAVVPVIESMMKR